jgi:hypothetical protein
MRISFPLFCSPPRRVCGGPAFEVFPHEVSLSDVRDRQSLVVRCRANGVHRNVTTEAKFALADMTGQNRKRHPLPAADGSQVSGVEGRPPVPVKVTSADRCAHLLPARCHAGS